MTKPRLPRLSPAELEIMKVLWDGGRASAREVHDQLAGPLEWAYSTTRTAVERLVKKGVVAKRQFHGLHVYEPAISRPVGLARMIRDFAANVLGSSPAPVLSLFADSGALSEEEVAELRELLVECEREDAP